MKRTVYWTRICALAAGVSASSCALAGTPDGDLKKAYRAAFGQDGPVTLTLKDGYARFTPLQGVKTAFGYALISGGQPVVGPNRDEPGFDAFASHASSPKVAVHYLTRDGAEFHLDQAFTPLLEIGSNFDGGPYARKGAVMDRAQTVYVEGKSMHQGYGCTELAIVELRPSGPVEVARLLDAVDFSGAGKPDHLSGRIVHIVPGLSFDVAYRGNRRFIDHYVKSGDRYVRRGKSGVPQC